MIGFKVALEGAKAAFFDADRIKVAMDRTTRRLLSRFGAYVRTRARTSIRSRKGTSKPGQPPRSHTGLLKNFIFFAYDADRHDVVIGPVKTHQVFGDAFGRPVTGTVPEVLEYGGAITIFEVFKWGKWRRADLRSRRRLAGLPRRKRTARVAARPFMHPAFDIEMAKLPPNWKNSLAA